MHKDARVEAKIFSELVKFLFLQQIYSMTSCGLFLWCLSVLLELDSPIFIRLPFHMGFEQFENE